MEKIFPLILKTTAAIASKSNIEVNKFMTNHIVTS